MRRRFGTFAGGDSPAPIAAAMAVQHTLHEGGHDDDGYDRDAGSSGSEGDGSDSEA